MQTHFVTILATAALTLPALGQCDPLWSNGWEGGYDFDSFAVQATGATFEVADDFEVLGEIQRVIAYGYACSGCPVDDVVGVRVRFYAWSPTGPGALEQEQFLAAGDPGLAYDGAGAGAGTWDLTLPAPFTATGRHFLSIQPQYATNGSWGFWGANAGNPDLTPMWYRDDADGAWGGYPALPWAPLLGHRDVNFALFGIDPTLPDPLAVCGSWEPVDSPNVGADSNSLSGIAAIAPDDLWAVGEYETVDGSNFEYRPLAMHWDGVDWSTTPVPCPSPTWNVDCGLDAIAATASGYVVAVGNHFHPGEAGHETFVVEWDGKAWIQLDSPTQPNGSGSRFVDVELLGEDDFWAVGSWPGIGFVGSTAPLAARWDGSSWDVHQPPIDPELFSFEWNNLAAVSAVAPDDVWAVGGHLSPTCPTTPTSFTTTGASGRSSNRDPNLSTAERTTSWPCRPTMSGSRSTSPIPTTSSSPCSSSCTGMARPGPSTPPPAAGASSAGATSPSTPWAATRSRVGMARAGCSRPPWPVAPSSKPRPTRRCSDRATSGQSARASRACRAPTRPTYDRAGRPTARGWPAPVERRRSRAPDRSRPVRPSTSTPRELPRTRSR